MKLIIKTHRTDLISDDRGLLHAIDDKFAIAFPNYWYTNSYKNGTWDGKKHFFSLLRGSMPTGLLGLLLEFLRSREVSFELRDMRTPLLEVEPILKLGRFDLISPDYDYQADAVRKSLTAGCGVLSIATNGGKTIIAASIIKSLGLPALFVVNGKDLLFQTYDVFNDVLEDVAMYGAGSHSHGTVTVAMAQSLVKLAKKTPSMLKRYEIIFSDECHRLPSDTLETIFNRCPARYRFGLSGTALDENPVRNYRLMAVTGPIISEIRNKELIERGVSAKPTVYFSLSKGDKLVAGTKYSTAVNLGIVYNEERNLQIVELVKKLQKEGKNTILVLSPRKMHGLELFNLMQYESMDVTFNHGSTPDFIRKTTLQEFKTEGGIMLASIIFDEGVDIPKMDALILAGGGKKFRRLLQRVGRALRKKEDENIVVVYDFYDWQHKNLAAHSANRLKAHLGEGFEVVPLEGTEAWVEAIKDELENPKPKVRRKPAPFVTKNRNRIAIRLKQLRKEK